MTPDEVKRKADRAEGKSVDEPEGGYEFGKEGAATLRKHPGGRPTKFKPEYAEQAAKLCMLGATDADLADFFKVTIRTIELWRSKHDEFFRSIKDAKEAADTRVERSLYQKAVGYTFDSEKVFQFQGDIIRAATREHVPPSDTAAIFWLKNRKPDMWREKTAVEHSVDESLAALVERSLNKA